MAFSFAHVDKVDHNGTKWAILVAGSRTWDNYRHQADICHAYQLLKRGGLKDDNIVVFMYDDIAYNKKNPHPGVILNHPEGYNLYRGVPKDYTGKNVNVGNFLAVLSGDRKSLKGGSGKVVNSKPNDTIFLFYSGHGAAGSVEMPTGPLLFGDALVNALKAKHKAGGYKEMVIYIEACQSGSLFQGLLPDNINVYAMTSSDSERLSPAAYCSPFDVFPCLGSLFGVAWMEDSQIHDRQKETLQQQYKTVKERLALVLGSPVRVFGNLSKSRESLSMYQGSDSGGYNTWKLA